MLQCLAAALLASTVGLSCAFGQAQVFNPASWDGPRTGPPKQAAKTVVFVAQDVRNGGITALFRNFENATRQLGWQVRLLDGAGQSDKLRDVALPTVMRKIVEHGLDEGGPLFSSRKS